MQLWSVWVGFLGDLLNLFATVPMLGSGFAIVVLTLLLRTVLLPLSWSTAYSACLRQKRLERLKPELERIRERFGSQPQVMIEETMKAYRRRGLRMIETRPLLGTFAQMPVLLGMFSLLRGGAEQARFLWVASLSRPDFWIALIAGLTTALMLAVNPDLPEQTRQMLIVVPAVIAFVFALQFASGLGLYWISSNCFTAVQTALVHRIVNRRLQAGTIRL